MWLYIMALMLILSDKPLDSLGFDEKLVSRPLMRSCLQVGLDLQVLDKREERYMFSKVDEFRSDLNITRRRFHDLANAPFVEESCVLPERSTVNELLVFNRAYKQHLENRLAFYPHSNDLRDARDETEALYQIWDCVRDATCEYYYIHIRRQALKKLVDILGPDYYIEVRKLPHVPLWRFTYIR